MPKQRSVIFAWAVSYGLVLLTALAIAAVTYVVTVRVMEKEIVNSNHYHLVHIQRQMDRMINDAQRLSQEIASDSRIIEYYNLKGSAQLADPYRFYRLVRMLGVYRRLNPSFSDFYLYFRQLDLVVSPNNFLDSRSFYQIYYAKSNLDYRKWRRTLWADYRGAFMPLSFESDSGQTVQTIAFIQSLPLALPLTGQRDVAANLVIVMDESRFMDDVRNLSAFNQGTMLILDSSNNILAASRGGVTKRALSPELRAGLRPREGVLHASYAGQQMVVSFVTSQLFDWKYLAMIPKQVFWEKANYIRTVTWVGLLVCVLLGGAITVYSLKTNYDPMHNLIKRLEKVQGINYDKRNNEYVFITQALDKVREDLSRLDTVLEQQNTVLREHFLIRLLRGKTAEKIPLTESLRLHRIDFQSDFFAVIVFHIEELGRFDKTERGASETEILAYYKKIHSLVGKVVEELLGPANRGFLATDDAMLVCLVNFAARELPVDETVIAQVAQKVRTLLEDSLEMLITAAVSDVHRTLAGIPEAYGEALQALEYQKILGVDEVVRYESIRELPQGNYYYPSEKEQQLINYIKIGDFDGARQLVAGIFEANAAKRFFPPPLMKCLCCDVFGTMLKALGDLNCREQADWAKELNLLERIWISDKWSEMQQTLIDILRQFCIMAATDSKLRTKNSDAQLIAAVRQYIEANYHDAGLGITAIAEHFQVHPVALSRMFKEVAGESMLDFINKTRIQAAKRLLKQNPGNLDEIAGTVGYYSTRTFTRTFKKVEGITPGKYKNIAEIE